MRQAEWVGSIATALVVGLQGCATPPAPPTQVVHVQTPGCAEARCVVSNDLGSWAVPRTPGSVSVSVSRQPLGVTCRTDDVSVQGVRALSSRPSTSGGGAAIGAVAGGAAVGAAFGATALTFIPVLGVITLVGGAAAGALAGDAAEAHSHPLRYPEVVSVPLSCGAGVLQARTAPRLGIGVRGLTPAEATAAGVGERGAVQVTDVAAGSIGAAGGLQAGDLILALNGQDVVDAAGLEERLLGLPAETPLVLRLWRDQRYLDLPMARPPGTH